LLHGLLFYFLFWCFGRFAHKFTPNLPFSTKIGFTIALIIELVWEIAENSPFIIERYRAATMALNYYGDSILNSSFDLLACALGYTLAARTSTRLAVGLAIFIEIFLLAVIRDNLTLNIVMLLFPLEFIKAWQKP